MDKHFVENHSGGYYFSTNDREAIEDVGEDFGNGDNILFTFEEEDMEEPFKSFAEYLTRNLFFTREGFLEKMESCLVEHVGVYAAVTEVTCNAIYEVDTNKDMLNSLLEEGLIDKELHDKLIDYLNDRLQKQLDFIKGTDKIYLTMNVERKKSKKKGK